MHHYICYVFLGSDEGFYYTHLGAGPTPEKLREMLEARFTVKGKQLRMVEVRGETISTVYLRISVASIFVVMIIIKSVFFFTIGDVLWH